MQPGFSLWSFGRAYLELYFDLCFDFLFFNKIYETSLLQEFCVFYSHLTTIPGAHEQNSAVERTIWEVRQAIKKKCDKPPKEWKSFLPVIQMEINERVSKRTKLSPFLLMFVRRRGIFPGDGKEDQEVLERRNANMLEIVYPEVAATAKRNSKRACEDGRV